MEPVAIQSTTRSIAKAPAMSNPAILCRPSSIFAAPQIHEGRRTHRLIPCQAHKPSVARSRLSAYVTIGAELGRCRPSVHGELDGGSSASSSASSWPAAIKPSNQTLTTSPPASGLVTVTVLSNPVDTSFVKRILTRSGLVEPRSTHARTMRSAVRKFVMCIASLTLVTFTLRVRPAARDVCVTPCGQRCRYAALR